MVIETLTGILVLITAIYAYLTHRMAVASEASVKAVLSQSEAMTRPYVSVGPYVRPHTNIIYLRVQNSGRTAAENVRLTLDRDFFKFGDKNRPNGNFRTMGVFCEVIDSMPPGFELLFALVQGPALFGPDADPNVAPSQFSITATYEYSGKRVTEVIRIDLRPYNESEGARSPVVDELERIRKVLEKS